ncbi:OTU domain-containing protein [uncultured Nostoc sp.]|uniref:OTU domain-containing protein n=1 Tax=uncultured Nostoc sp. TaxID=340711 RepID=UPI0035CAED10
MSYLQQTKKQDNNNSNPKDSRTTDSHKPPKKDGSKPLSLSNQKSGNLLERDSKQAASSSRAEENDSPNLVGIEQELTSVTLTLTKNGSEADKKNGVKLAETNEKAFSDFPVFKLETEGAERNSLCIELIYGPLKMEEYEKKALIDAKKKLFDQLGIRQTLRVALEKYNNQLQKGQERYRLILDPASDRYNVVPKKKSTNTNTQTNVAIPYSKLGKIPQRGETGFEEMFLPNERKFYQKARDEAKIIKQEIDNKIDKIPNGKYLQSLLTHIIFQEAKFIQHRINKNEIEDKHKHHFHVMLKLSPEDAIISILSKEENEALGKWLKEGEAQLQKSIENTLKTLGNPRDFKKDIKIKSIKNQLEKAIIARSKGAKKLKLINTDTNKKESEALDESNKVIKDENDNDITIGHTHPRPTNRISVYSQYDEHYMVVEQRSGSHMLNDGKVEDNFDSKSKLIAGVSTAKKFFINHTKGDGNCFFHAVYEAMHNQPSTTKGQEEIRQNVRNQLENNEKIQKHLFGDPPDLQSIQREIQTLNTGEWTQNHTIAYVAEALSLTIIIYNPDGSHRYTATPSTSTSSKTIEMTYTGDHFNSHTQKRL